VGGCFADGAPELAASVLDKAACFSLHIPIERPSTVKNTTAAHPTSAPTNTESLKRSFAVQVQGAVVEQAPSAVPEKERRNVN
jgi:hypothetical protein